MVHLLFLILVAFSFLNYLLIFSKLYLFAVSSTVATATTTAKAAATQRQEDDEQQTKHKADSEPHGIVNQLNNNIKQHLTKDQFFNLYYVQLFISFLLISIGFVANDICTIAIMFM